MSVGEVGVVGFTHQSAIRYKFHARTVYLHSTFTVPPIGGAFGIQSSICGEAFMQK